MALKDDDKKIPGNDNPSESKTEQEDYLTESEKNLRAQQRKRAMRKKRKKIMKRVFVAIVIVAIFGFFALKFFSGKIEEANKPYTTYTVGTRDITVVLSGAGSVKPVKTYTVSARVTGEVIEAPVVEGGTVEKGDVLYVIDSSDAQSTIKNAENSLKNARLSYNDVVDGYDDLYATSDYTGVVTSLDVKVGDTVSAMQVIGHIRDDSVMLLKVPFFSSDIAQINVGDYVDVTLTDYFQTVGGTVKEISGASVAQANGTRTQMVTVSVENPGGITVYNTASANINGIPSADNGAFECNVDKSLLAGVSGKITSLAIAEGDTITEGMTYIRVSSESIDKSLDKAKISLDNANTNYENALEKLDDYTITAPISGTVVETYYNLGESVASESGYTMAIIYDMSQYTFDMNIDELDIVSVSLNQEVKITCDARSGSEYVGYISKISKQGATSNGVTSYPVTITIEDPLALEELLPGMNVDAEIVLDKHESVVAVPVGAVGRGNMLKVVKAESVAKYAQNKAQSEEAEAKGANAQSNENVASNAQKGNANSQKNANSQNNASVQRPGSQGNSAGGFGGRGASGAYGEMPADIEFDSVKVSLGVSDDDYVEITSGLSAGDVIIIENSPMSFSFFGVSGGGMGMGGMPMGGGAPMSGGAPMGGQGRR